MKYYCILFIVCLFSTAVFAQTPDARALVKEGIDLYNQKNYPAAIDKYKAALAIDPDNASANYNLAFTLYRMGKGKEGIPNLQRVTNAESVPIKAGAYKLLGAIYDQDNQPLKAIESYNAGLKVDVDATTLQNLALVYSRTKQYTEAEKAAVAAITLKPASATSSYRTYALVTFHQNKRAAALLGFCSFLMMEPNSNRSAEALGNIQHILQGGALKPDPGEVAPAHMDADNNALNLAITKAIAPFATRRYASAGDLLAAQLKAVFTAVGTLAETQTGNDFFRKHLAAYFNQLAKTNNMPAFARFISQSTPESAKWIKDNAPAMTDLDAWVKGTDRGF
jgi:tetratricopeptide (TPR) repeat protein